MKIYTKTGDDGQTGLPGGRRVPKDAAVTEVCGTIDELNTTLGMARASAMPDDLDVLLETIQRRLFDLGAEVAERSREGSNLRCESVKVPLTARISSSDVADLEAAIDRCEAELAPLRNFILPGGAAVAAQLHFARAVCRRAERRLVGLMRECPDLSAETLIYLNRLGDLLFDLARLANLRHQQPDAVWLPRN